MGSGDLFILTIIFAFFGTLCVGSHLFLGLAFLVVGVFLFGAMLVNYLDGK